MTTMVLLPSWASPDPTLEALDRVLEQIARREPRRTYLGFSSIGAPWDDLRSGRHDIPDAYGIKCIEDGHRGEALMAARLRMVAGIVLYTVNPKTGGQFEFSYFDGLFKGHCDGIIKGLRHDPLETYVWEHKSCNPTKQMKLHNLRAECEHMALAKWDEIYYAQAIMYMHASNLKKHWLTCSTPGERSSTAVTTLANPRFAEELIEKARVILTERGLL